MLISRLENFDNSIELIFRLLDVHSYIRNCFKTKMTFLPNYTSLSFITLKSVFLTIVIQNGTDELDKLALKILTLNFPIFIHS